MESYIEVTFHDVQEIDQDVLIALLAAEGYTGFEQTSSTLLAYIAETNFNAERLASVARGYDFHHSLISPKNWNQLWESTFDPVVIDKFCCIRASFHPPNPFVKHDIIITPKMSFGTGHHPTTQMMILMMKDLDLVGKKVMDYGTGTGVLAVLADRMGAGEVLAIDNDEWSISNARENFIINKCLSVHIIQQSAPESEDYFGVILCNINLDVIISKFSTLKKHLAAGGVLIISGFLTSDMDKLMQKIVSEKLSVVKQHSIQNWICLMLRQP